MAEVMKVVFSIIVLVGVGMPILAALVSDTVDLDSATETITASNGTAVSLSNSDIIASSFTATNGTLNLSASDYTLGADAGTFTLTNNTFDGQSLTTSYNFKPVGYADSALVRLILPLTLVGLAIAALLIGFNMMRG